MAFREALACYRALIVPWSHVVDDTLAPTPIQMSVATPVFVRCGPSRSLGDDCGTEAGVENRVCGGG